MIDDDTELIDPYRSSFLCDVGASDYIAATTVGATGQINFVLARRDALGDDDVKYAPTCPEVTHEQLGPMPLEFVRLIALSFRRRRKTNPTPKGTP